MNLTPVRSSAIAAIGYNPVTRTLFIRFTSGSQTYEYFGVPITLYNGLMGASSHGTYFDRYIQNQYGG